jgi:hypothetical protein
MSYQFEQPSLRALRAFVISALNMPKTQNNAEITEVARARKEGCSN